MKHRKGYAAAQVKALPDTGTGAGEFEAIVSVFGNVDLVGDRVMPGAFAKSLERWAESGDPIPVVWSHDWNNPDAHIGTVTLAEERDEGLYVKGVLDIADNAFAAQVYRLLSRRSVKEFSFAYDVLDEAVADDDVNELLELDLIEVGPTLKGANPDTELLAVKAVADAAERAAKATAARAAARDGGTTSSADGSKAYVTLAGSLDERLRAVSTAVRMWAAEYFAVDDEGYRTGYAYAEATYDDRVIAAVEDYAEGRSYFLEFPYTVSDEGQVELGEPAEVTLTGVVSPKALGRGGRGAKAGRVLSKANERRLRDARDLVDEVLGALDDDDEKSSGSDAGAVSEVKPNGKAHGADDRPAMNPHLALVREELAALEV